MRLMNGFLPCTVSRYFQSFYIVFFFCTGNLFTWELQIVVCPWKLKNHIYLFYESRTTFLIYSIAGGLVRLKPTFCLCLLGWTCKLHGCSLGYWIQTFLFDVYQFYYDQGCQNQGKDQYQGVWDRIESYKFYQNFYVSIVYAIEL